ncbi:MAG: flagellar hook protein FlgE [Aurantimonas coralicida]|uniref:flagellar hook protein FlgE n=1 Tax=unclassified Aurantimonas TaxID=2638230 RepID=UPI001652651A|nr:flagellar hook protein FlgE [Aurantimonas sp. DM33-3]MBC6716489.1 flagellar hook protein FlgE [Aurantimonas sp. DM33-3]
MSINGVFRTSVSGMNAQANRLSTVSENIANSSTNGYKRNSTEFASLVLAQGGGEYNPGSVKTQVRQSISQQGSIAATSSGSDLAIQGDGFFVVQDTAGREFYTRAGSFVQRTETVGGKETTFLVNTAGYRLTGTPVGGGAAAPIELPVGAIVAPQATNAGSFSIQFPESAAVGDTKKSSMVVYDKIGKAIEVPVEMEKTGANTWDITVGGGAPTTIVFDPNTGRPTAAPANMTYTPVNGDAIDIEFESLTEYATDFSAKLVANGNPPGSFTGFAFADDGTLSGVMNTGQLIPLYEMNLARFASPDQLQASAGNVYSATASSGVAALGGPGTNGYGSLVSSGLEQSNVDLASELTSMIESQRSYSANSKVFQTGAEILDVLVNLKR